MRCVLGRAAHGCLSLQQDGAQNPPQVSRSQQLPHEDLEAGRETAAAMSSNSAMTRRSFRVGILAISCLISRGVHCVARMAGGDDPAVEWRRRQDLRTASRSLRRPRKSTGDSRGSRRDCEVAHLQG